MGRKSQGGTAELIRTDEAAGLESQPSTTLVDQARNYIDAVRREAAEYGFTDADVVKALLRPMFETRSRCACASCRTRRGEDIAEDATSGEDELRVITG